MINKRDIKNLVGKMDVILEIGCADGSDTDELMNFGKVYGFEPEPRNIATLKNRLPELQLFEGAVSDVDGVATFNRSRTNDPEALRLSGSILPPKNHTKNWNWIYFDETVTVPTVKLDTFCKDMPVIDFIWCDAQGAEGKIIDGAKETLKKTRYLFTEYCNDEHYEGQPTLHELKKMLPDFEVVMDYGTDVLFKNKNL
jgi:FkbM family methyltransferase